MSVPTSDNVFLDELELTVSAELAQAEAWAQEYDQGWNAYQAKLEAQAEAEAEPKEAEHADAAA